MVALALNSLAALSGSRLPLTAVQLLWVNLIMDSLGALALATEPPTDALLSAAPAGRGAPIVSNHMYRNIGAMAAWQLAVLLGLYFGGAAALGLDGAGAGAGAAGAAGAGAGDGGSLRTLVFNAFVFMQLFNEVNARAVQEDDVLAGLGGNRAFVAIWLATAATQAALVAFGGDFAATVPLDAAQWALCLGVGASVLPVALLVKRIPVPDAPPLPQLLLPWLRPKSA